MKRGRKQEKEGRKNQVGSRERITQPLYSLCTSCTAMKNAAKSIQLRLALRYFVIYVVPFDARTRLTGPTMHLNLTR